MGRSVRLIRNPRVVLDNLAAQSHRQEYRYRRLYRNFYNPLFYFEACKKLYAHQRMGEVKRKEKMNAIHLEQIEQLIQQIKDQSYRPYPIRKNQKQMDQINRIEDQLVQEIVRCILEHIYEGKFSYASHGFRPRRSCYTALRQIKQFSQATWFFVGEIHNPFQQMDPHVLISILRKTIDDEKWIQLIWKFIKAGYLNDWKYDPSFSGVPKGGIISPILVNIYLNELDQYVEEIKRRFLGRGKENRLYYIRYAHHLMLGVAGSKEDCLRIKQELADFLQKNLKLEFSSKSKISHASKKVRFLGYDICKQKQLGCKQMGKQEKTKIALYLPKEVWLKRLIDCQAIQMNPKTKKWKSTHRSLIVQKTDLEILKSYNDEIKKLYHYYRMADNLSKSMNKFKYYLKYSMYKTFAYKYKTSVPQILRRYQINGHFGVKVQTKEGMKIFYFFDPSLKKQM